MTLSSVRRYDSSRVQCTGGHAVVVGASMAGMTAARVLADAFETVTVLDRDDLPDEPVPRRGLPQDEHVHLLLEAGRATLEDLFPNFGRDLLGAGGVLVDGATDLSHYEHGGYLADGPERMALYCASRPLIEYVVRNRLTTLPSVTLRSECQFVEYTTDDAGTAVTGVRVTGNGVDERTLEADLVVDATGRTSRTPQWLDGHGYVAPPAEEIGVDIAYSTVAIDRPSGDLRTVLVAPTPPDLRGGATVPIEDDRWLVTLFGYHGERPPTDPEGLLEYASGLPAPDLHRLLEERDWHSDCIKPKPFPSTLRRRYEQLDRFPEGLVVTGDGIASFNPIYGQGMSVAALEAVQLHHALAGGHRSDVATSFFDRASDVVDVVWDITVGSDFAFPQTDGKKPRGTDLFNRYLARLVRAAHTDGWLRTQYYRVVRLELHPRSLLRPAVIRRVLFPSG